ncbi:MAG TPA: PAS domain S-box protein [Pirellulaceae bacterium]|nr:PAS domain S-box protein [Pirellulaceae bacterium]
MASVRRNRSVERSAGWWVAIGWTVASAAATLGLIADAAEALPQLILFSLGLTLALAGIARMESGRLRDRLRLRLRLQRARSARRHGNVAANARHSSSSSSLDGTIGFELDEQRRFVVVSDEFAAWCGFGRDYLLGRPASALCEGNSAESLIPESAFEASRRRAWHGTLRWSGSDGRQRTALGSLVRVVVGRTVRFRWVGFDTTEQERRMERLASERSHLDAIFHASPSAMLVVDADGRVRRANRLARRWFGPGDPTGKQLMSDLFRVVSIDGERTSAEQHPFHRIRRSGEPLLDDRWRLEDPAAEGRIVSVYGTPITDARGAFAGCVLNLHDLTEQTENRMRLHDYRQRLELAFEGSGTAIWDWYVDSGALVLSQRWSEVLGYDAAELEPRIETWTRLTHPDDLDALLASIQRHFQGETPHFESELRMRRRDGSYRWLSIRGRLISRDRDGLPLRILGVMLDIDAQRSARETAERQSALLENVLDLVPYAIWWKDRDGRYSGANRAFVRALGIDGPAELIGRTDDELTWSSSALERLAVDDRTIMGTCESRLGRQELLRMASGDLRTLLVSKVPLRGADGGSIGVLGCFDDITDRRRAESDLRRMSDRAVEATRELELSRERLELALTATDDVLFDWNVAEDQVTLSTLWTGLLAEDQPVPRNRRDWFALIHPEDLDRAERELADHFSGLTSQCDLEYRIRDAQSGYRWILTRARLLERDEHGRPLRLVGTHTDISRRKGIEEELVRLRGQLAIAVESIDAGLVMVDAERRIQLVNRRFREMYPEVAELAVPGADYRAVLRTYAERVPSVRCELSTDSWTERTLTAIDRGQDERNEELPNRHVHVSDRPTVDGGFVSLRTDLTLLMTTQRELDRARRAAEVANRAKSEFLANMSHEIRTPMTSILGFADLLLAEPDPELRAEHVRTIRRNGRHLLAIINDILDLSKIEAGKVELESIPFSLRTLVADVIELLQVRVRDRNVRLEGEVAAEVPQLLLGDPTRIRQVLTNLVGNAVKFTQEGSIRVRAAISEGTGRITITVTDTGIGISDAELMRVFDPFQQGDASATRKYGGTGLGLAISRRLVSLMGGELVATSEVGIGSCFQLSLPDLRPAPGTELPIGDDRTQRALPVDGFRNESAATSEDSTRESSAAVDVRSASGETEPSGPKRALRVLVADDGPDNRQLLKFLLAKANVEFEIVEDGAQAVERLLAEPNRFDLLLLDMQMPVMDGYTAARRLRELGFDLPIVALTAHTMAGDAEKCFEAGCSGFLGKPIERSQLIEVLAKAKSEALAKEPQA